MSHEQERLVWRALELVNDGDIDGIVAITPPEAEYVLIGGFDAVAGETVLKGPEGMRRFYTDWFETFTTTHVEPTAFLETGDRLLVLSCVEVTAKGSDAPARMLIGQIYSFENGAISRVESYYDTRAALKAAGVNELDVRDAPAVTGPPAPP
jgi:ketosteroid isomerase-like protein